MYSSRATAFIFFFLITCLASPSQGFGQSMEWVFPIRSPHAGPVVGNQESAAMVWGNDRKLHISLGKKGVWDRRGGLSRNAPITYEELKKMLGKQDYQAVFEAFKTKPAINEPNRQASLGAGRLTITLPKDYRLTKATLNLNQAHKGIIVNGISSDGNDFSINIYSSFQKDLFQLESMELVLAETTTTWENVTTIDSARSRDRNLPLPITRRGKQGYLIHQSLPKDSGITCQLSIYDKNKASILLRKANKAKWLSVETINSSDKKKDELAWNDYWASIPAFSLPDSTLMLHYYYNAYKLFFTLHPNGTSAGLQGAMLESYQLPPWAADYHFNINVQMMYQPCFRMGKAESFVPMLEMIHKWFPQMKKDGEFFFGKKDAMMLPHSTDDQGRAISSFWTGTIDHASLAWMANMAWQYFRYSHDSVRLKSIIYPMLVGAFIGYQAMVEETETGKLSLPLSVSPEFGGKQASAWGKNASFQLAAFRMVCHDIMACEKAMGLQQHSASAQQTLEKLSKYSVEKTMMTVEYPEYKKAKIMLWNGQDLPESHRHHSHLAGIYPFQLYDPLDTSSPDHHILKNSLKYWYTLGTGFWAGWSYPWAAVLLSRNGYVNAAIEYLQRWNYYYTTPGKNPSHHAQHKGLAFNEATPVDKNGSIKEVMQLEAGFGFLSAVHEIFVQEYSDYYRVLPAVPTKWKKFSAKSITLAKGLTLSLNYDDQLLSIEIRAEQAQSVRLLLPEAFDWQVPSDCKLDLKAGQCISIMAEKAVR